MSETGIDVRTAVVICAVAFLLYALKRAEEQRRERRERLRGVFLELADVIGDALERTSR